jgi:hypothetical protein
MAAGASDRTPPDYARATPSVAGERETPFRAAIADGEWGATFSAVRRDSSADEPNVPSRPLDVRRPPASPTRTNPNVSLGNTCTDRAP